MADSFNGIGFSVMTQLMVPEWEQDSNVTMRHVPYSNRDLVQFGGRSNYKVTVPVRVRTSGDVPALQALNGDGVAHTLVLYGVTYASTYLIGAAKPEKIPDAWLNGSFEWRIDLTFMRAGA